MKIQLNVTKLTRFVSVAAIFIMTASISQAGYEAFLKFEGPDIKGEVRDWDYKDWVEILGFSWGASHDGSQRSGTVGDLLISKPLDRASPELFLRCVLGVHFSSAELHLRKPSGERVVFYEILLEEVHIRSIETKAAESGERPVEHLTLSFGKIEVAYTPTLVDGTPGERTSVWWDSRSDTGGTAD